MYYPEDFKQRCRELYPNYIFLHQALEEGHPIVGSCLLESRLDYGIPAEEINPEDSQETIKEKRGKLFSEWNRLEKEQRYLSTFVIRRRDNGKYLKIDRGTGHIDFVDKAEGATKTTELCAYVNARDFKNVLGWDVYHKLYNP